MSVQTKHLPCRWIEGCEAQAHWPAARPVWCDSHARHIKHDIKRGVQAVKEGKVRPWEDVERELGL